MDFVRAWQLKMGAWSSVDDVQKAGKDFLYSFSQADRLRTTKDFQAVFDAKSGRVVLAAFVALYRFNRGSPARLGIINKKGVIKRAVGRNWIKRIIRESFRQHKDQLKELDILILMRSKWFPLKRNMLRDNLSQLWPILRNLQ